jgi:hypothetical protein
MPQPAAREPFTCLCVLDRGRVCIFGGGRGVRGCLGGGRLQLCGHGSELGLGLLGSLCSP